MWSDGQPCRANLFVLELDFLEVLVRRVFFRLELAAQAPGVDGLGLEFDPHEIARRVAGVFDLMSLLDRVPEPESAGIGGRSCDRAVTQSDMPEDDRAAVV